MDSKKLTSTILELTSEDAYGSWELWWNISAHVSKDEFSTLRDEFISVVSLLVQEGKIRTLNLKHGGKESYSPVVLVKERLKFELDHVDDPNPSEFYWFEATEEGEKEDIRLRSF